MILTDALAAAGAALDRGQAAELVRRLSELDRYPASAGLAGAAELVAGAAGAAGVRDVEVLRWPVAGEPRRWWTFRAPASWTPGPARLGWRGRVLVDYPRDAFGLALNSAAADGIRAALVRGRSAPWRGAVVLVEEPVVSPALLAEIELAGARGVVCSPGWPDWSDKSEDEDCTRRVELPPGAGIFAFSLRPSAMRELLAGHRAGDQVEATVRVATGAPMPVVTGVVPGEDPGLGEVVVHAHLDHPRPSANDNASGVVACLEVARALARLPGRRRSVRFLWGPEFTGSAAYLHDVVAAGPLPAALVNLDMVGEHERVTGGLLNVERSPLGTPDVASAAVRMALDGLPGPRRTYAGARAVPAVPWVAVPFVGASDHLLYLDLSRDRADLARAVSATSLSHHPDRYRHSSGDTADRVDLDRLLAVAGCAAVAVQLLAAPDPGQLALACLSARYADLLDVVRCATGEPPGRVEPAAAGRAHRRLAAVLAGADLDLAWIADLAGAEPGGLAGYRDGLRAAATSLAPLLPPAEDGRPAGPAPRRCWDGPFNLFAALDAVDERARQRAWDGIGQDRGAGYARLVALALAADGARDLDGVIEAAAFSSGLSMSTDGARGWLEALLAAGWLALGEAP